MITSEPLHVDPELLEVVEMPARMVLVRRLQTPTKASQDPIKGPLQPPELAELAELMDDIEAFVTTLDHLPEHLRPRTGWWPRVRDQPERVSEITGLLIMSMPLIAAFRALDDSLAHASRSKLAPFVKLARTIRHYRASIEATLE
ncbi:MAG TPA: hypothetical protein VKU92_10145 [Acidimicrobiales bacterium]|nr:hypothetical protein [Acidimicrobiales bacterium]